MNIYIGYQMAFESSRSYCWFRRYRFADFDSGHFGSHFLYIFRLKSWGACPPDQKRWGGSFPLPRLLRLWRYLYRIYPITYSSPPAS